MADRDGRYEICGPNAFNRYGFSDQVPNRAYAYNNRLSGERTIGAISQTLIKVSDAPRRRRSARPQPRSYRRPPVAPVTQPRIVAFTSGQDFRCRSNGIRSRSASSK